MAWLKRSRLLTSLVPRLLELSNRVADLLNVAVDANDGLPQCINRRSKRRLETPDSAILSLGTRLGC